jgi:hypothetical protein
MEVECRVRLWHTNPLNSLRIIVNRREVAELFD